VTGVQTCALPILPERHVHVAAVVGAAVLRPPGTAGHRGSGGDGHAAARAERADGRRGDGPGPDPVGLPVPAEVLRQGRAHRSRQGMTKGKMEMFTSSRRRFLAAAGALGAAGLSGSVLAGCGSGGSNGSGAKLGTTELQLPNYIPNTRAKPD